MQATHSELGMRTKSKGYKRYLNAGLLEEVDETFVGIVSDYWLEKFDKQVDPTLPIAFSNLTGRKDDRVIPPLVMWNDIIPYFNDEAMMRAYSEKNIYDTLINLPNSVENVVKRIRSNYYDSDNNPMNQQEVLNTLLDTEDSYIIKPSDTDDGVGIKKITINDKQLYVDGDVISLDEMEIKHKNNFSIQKIIKQHHVMAQPHPQSVNTLRMVTLRFKGEIHYLLTFARFGANNSVNDNAGTGGVCLGVQDNGKFLDIAVDADINTYTHHPTTNFEFKKMGRIENFDKFINYVVEGHKKILHHDFVSWDIAVDVDGNPLFIEANFKGATWLYQLASQRPIFGDLTDEVVDYLKDEFKSKNNRNVRLTNADRKKMNKKNKEIKELKKEVREKNKLIKQLQGK